jgi:protein LTV1
VDRHLDSIALTAECMDDDIAELLFGDVDFEQGEFEELNDEFILDAAKEPEAGEEDQGFDFAAHIAGLMAKARMESDDTNQLQTIHEQARKDQDFFAGAKPVGDDDDDSDDFNENGWQIDGAPGIVPKLGVAAEKALCDKFNATLLEYDSDEIGECYDEDEVVGPRALEGDTLVEQALDDFLQEKKDEIFMQGARHYMEGNFKGGSGFSALVGTKMVPVKDLDESALVHDGIRPIEDLLGEADGVLGKKKDAPPAEEVFIDGKSYYSLKLRNPWDCESILSTYSNLDNNPVTIGAGGRRR